MDRDIIGVEIDLCVKAGRGLVAKDGGGLFSKAKSSDPYVRVMLGKTTQLSRTPTISKTLDPVWNHAFKHVFAGRELRVDASFTLAIYDHDSTSRDDPMGEVMIPLKPLLDGQVSERWYPVANCAGCKNATGELEVRASVLLRRALTLSPHDSVAISDRFVAAGLGWDMLPDGRAIDLDASCVCVSPRGDILPAETVYFGRLSSQSGAIRHTGDEKEGDEDLGAGDDEIITVDLARVPMNVAAMFFIGTVASESRSFLDVASARIRLVEWTSGIERCRYVPAMAGAHTTVFLARLARKDNGWVMTAIGDVDHTARDWGTVVPEIKAYMADLVPGIRVDPNERVAVMRKGGEVRLRDFCPGGLPQTAVLGLYWDVTNGKNIDLDASVVMLDSAMQQIDLVFFNKLASNDGAVQHGGDEREGDEKGDDERIFIQLAKVHPAVVYIGLVINSYSGEELDDVKDAGVHLFDGSSFRDIARYEMSNTAALDKHTALVMGMLYREPNSGDWCLRIISEAAQGRTAHENVDELQAHLRRSPVTPLAPPREQLPPGAGEAMVAKQRLAMATGTVVAATVVPGVPVVSGMPAV